MCGFWSVEGRWAITSSPEDSGGHWEPGSHMGTLNLHVTEPPSGKAQICAKFDFEHVTSIVRLADPEDASAISKPAVKTGEKRSHAERAVGRERWFTSVREDDYDGDLYLSEEDEEDKADAGATSGCNESNFVITSSARPSAEHPTWSYRWRGEETGEWEIALGSDEKIYAITFGGGLNKTVSLRARVSQTPGLWERT